MILRGGLLFGFKGHFARLDESRDQSNSTTGVGVRKTAPFGSLVSLARAALNEIWSRYWRPVGSNPPIAPRLVIVTAVGCHALREAAP